MNRVKPILVFDLGGVVFDWNPKLFLKDLCSALGLADDRADLLGLAVFQDYGLTADWLQFDRGAIDIASLSQRIAQRLIAPTGQNAPPTQADRKLARAESRAIDDNDVIAITARIVDWIEALGPRLTPIPETIEWLKHLREAGFRIYFLSNMPKPFIQHLHVHQAVFSQFSDGLFSSHVGWVKPETEIFSLARERFTRRQQEYLFNEGWTNARTHEEQEQALVFFDDSLANVQAAKRLGWQAIQFRDARQASRDFQQLQGQGIHLKRSVRSFVVRAGRIGSGQSKALSSLAPLYCIAMPQADATPFCEHWPAAHRHKPLVVDIGFGMGDALASMAAQDPSHRYLGIEVHPPGVGSLLQRIHDQGLDHVRVIQHDAIEVLERVIAPDSVAAFHIYFPDPWPKKRHHKRRLVQKAFVGLLSSRLANNGYVHCATDWEPYAQWMLEVLSAQTGLRNQALGYHQRPAWRPITKFEARGLKLGHTVTDLLFRKQS